MKEKLLKIIIPFAVVSTSLLLTYSTFYWLIFIQLKLIDINEEIFSFFVPFGIATCLTWFYLRKKLRLLKLSDRYRDFVLFVSWISLSGPILFFLFYLDTETGDLTNLKQPSEIFNTELTKYYSIENSFQLKDNSGLFVSKVSVDRGNEIGIGCYFVCPITNVGDSIGASDIWIGVLFSNKFSNRVFDDKEKQSKLISRFIDSTINVYKKYTYKTSYLKKLSNSNEKDNFIQAIAKTNLPFNSDNVILLKEESGNYATRTGTSLWWTIFTLIASNLIWFMLTMFQDLKQTKK